jgi:hypothetical protein
MSAIAVKITRTMKSCGTSSASITASWSPRRICSISWPVRDVVEFELMCSRIRMAAFAPTGGSGYALPL